MGRAQIVARIAELPDGTVFGDAGFGTSRTWFATTEAAALPQGAEAAYVLCGGAAVPMLRQGARLSSMTTPYSWIFQPALPDASAFARICRRFAVTTIEAVDEAWTGLPPMEASLRAAGLIVRRYAHFGNWQEPIGGRGWTSYLSDRPGRLREVLRRRGRDAGDTMRMEMIAAPEDVPRGAAVYEAVYARSWKVPEPYPHFGPLLLRAAAAEGALRLAIAWRGDVPLAAQYWMLSGGTATVLKLAHDEAARALSPGTLLTAWAVRWLIERDGVARLDFGRGDDGYKQLWAGERRQRIGLLAGAPWHPLGALAIGRQVLGAARRHIHGLMPAKDKPT